MKYIVMVLGALMLAMGLLWIGQGLNWIRWPASSFMLGVPKWSWYGTVLAIVGGLLIRWARRR